MNVSTVGHNLLLTGTIASTSAPANTFDVSMSFTLWSDIAASMFVGDTPEAKKELNSIAYDPLPAGGGNDPTSWDFYLLDTGSTLTGIGGAVSGLILDLDQRPKSNGDYGPFLGQLGFGANGKNLHYGFSTWFYYQDRTTAGINGQGDVNIDVPEPATLAIFGIGLAGLGLMRRRKRLAA